MKGVSYLIDENNLKKAVVIELEVLSKYETDLEDLLDGLVAEARMNEEKVPLEKVLEDLKKSGKI